MLFRQLFDTQSSTYTYLLASNKGNAIIVDPVLEKFLAMHQSIAHLYLQGVSLGNKVQCLESDLVFSIVDKLTRADIPCLTVHDSIIVQKKYQGLVRDLMNGTTFPDRELVGWLA